MAKFTLQLLLISLMTLLASAFISFHVGLAIYLLGSTIALLNYEKSGGVEDGTRTKRSYW